MDSRVPDWLKEQIPTWKLKPDQYWWLSDDDFVYFGQGERVIICASQYEIFGSMTRSGIRHQIKVLEENKHMRWHAFSEEFELLKDPNFKALTITI